MGVLIVSFGDRHQAQDRAEEAIVAAGFRQAWRLEEDGVRIFLTRKLNGEGGLVWTGNDGDFAIATGTLIYAGVTGLPALKSFFYDFNPAKPPPWEAARGHWCVLLRKHGVIHLINDQLNASKIYCDEKPAIFSNSFVALCEMGLAKCPHEQGCYEYVWNGTVFGTKTFLKGIGTLPNNACVIARNHVISVARYEQAYRVGPLSAHLSADDIADHWIELLRGLFRLYRTSWSGKIRSGLSGGYDSRLLLSLLLDSGISPTLFVYGDPESTDVRVAKAICAAEGLPLDHLNKSSMPPIQVDAYAELVTANAIALDGWTYDGLFGQNPEHSDRLARATNGSALMAGSVGEIFRNFFYLRNRPYSLRELVWTFYSRYAPSACTLRFQPAAYEDSLIADLAAAIGIPPNEQTSRQAVEMAYPLFRGRYWSARDAVINQRFGTTIYPFLEPTVFEGTWNIPLALKNFGRLEGRMIRRLSPKLAAHASAYGFNFGAEPPWKYRAKMTFNHWRPLVTRKLAYRLQYARPLPRPYYLQERYITQLIDPSFPIMRRLFYSERIHDPEALNRLCTIEYLCERYGTGG